MGWLGSNAGGPGHRIGPATFIVFPHHPDITSTRPPHHPTTCPPSHLRQHHPSLVKLSYVCSSWQRQSERNEWWEVRLQQLQRESRPRYDPPRRATWCYVGPHQTPRPINPPQHLCTQKYGLKPSNLTPPPDPVKALFVMQKKVRDFCDLFFPGGSPSHPEPRSPNARTPESPSPVAQPTNRFSTIVPRSSRGG